MGSERQVALEAMREALAKLLACPASRETALAATNLQQAILWLRAAIEGGA